MMCHPSDDGRLVPAPPRSACACLLEHTIGANAFDSSWHIAVSKLGVNHVIWPGSAAMRREKGSAVLSSDNFRRHRYSSSCNNDCWMACGRRAEPISRAIANMLRTAGGVRRLGAAALDFCFLADGRYLGYYEMALKPWDMAAGSLIAEEAGAVLSDFEGNPVDLFTSAGVVAAVPPVHSQLLEQAAPAIRLATA